MEVAAAVRAILPALSADTATIEATVRVEIPSVIVRGAARLRHTREGVIGVRRLID